eukprot:c27310_g1_i2 orf=164-2986(+)
MGRFGELVFLYLTRFGIRNRSASSNLSFFGVWTRFGQRLLPHRVPFWYASNLASRWNYLGDAVGRGSALQPVFMELDAFSFASDGNLHFGKTSGLGLSMSLASTPGERGLCEVAILRKDPMFDEGLRKRRHLDFGHHEGFGVRPVRYGILSAEVKRIVREGSIWEMKLGTMCMEKVRAARTSLKDSCSDFSEFSLLFQILLGFETSRDMPNSDRMRMSHLFSERGSAPNLSSTHCIRSPAFPKAGSTRQVSATSIRSPFLTSLGKVIPRRMFPMALCKGYSSHSEQEACPEIILEKLFQKTEQIVQILGLLRKWDEDTQKSLTDLHLNYDTAIVTQVLRGLRQIRKPTSDSNSQEMDAAKGFFKWLKTVQGFKHDQYTYSVMMNALGKAGRIDEMQALFKEMREEGCPLTVDTCTKAMLWLGRAERFDDVVRLWEEMKEAGIKPSVSIYTVIMDNLARAKQFQGVANIYMGMLKEEHLPNARTHTVLVQHLANMGKLDGAFKILGIMEKMKVVPNNVTYEVLIAGYAKIGNLEMVTKLVNAMREHFLRPGIRLVGTVRALQKAGKLEEANVLAKDIWPVLSADDNIADTFLSQFGEMEGGTANDDTVHELSQMEDLWRTEGGLNAVLDLNALALALQTWNPAVEEVLGRANIKWNSLLAYEILRRVKNQEAAHNFFRFVSGQPGFKHDSYTCMLMMQKVLRSKINAVRKVSMIEEMLGEMQQEGLLSVPMLNMVIRYFINETKIEEALCIFDFIRDFGLEPNEASYNTMIEGLARDRQGRRAMDLYKEMQAGNLQPSSKVYIELIKCVGLAGKIDMAYSLFKKMTESGITLGAEEYAPIISIYSKAGDQKTALALYEDMRRSGIRPSQGTYELVTDVLRKAKRVSDLQALERRRNSYDLFGGRNKMLQESLLSVISIFCNAFGKTKSQSTFDGDLVFCRK